MKTWLLKLKISNAFNDRRPLPSAVERELPRSGELRRFAADAAALDHALKNQLPRLEPSAPLHTAIMRAVRAARTAPAAEIRPFFWPRWAPAAGFALLILAGVILAPQFSPFSPAPAGPLRPAASPALAEVSSTLEAGGSLVREAPDAALSPLSDEMQKLNRKLVDTGQFLLASLP